MRGNLRSAFFAGLATAVIALVVSWLITNESSPLDNYLLYNPELRNIWYALNFPSYFAGAATNGYAHSVNESVAWLVFLLQWFAVGFFIVAIGGVGHRRFAT